MHWLHCIIARKNTHQYSCCQGTAAEDTTIQTSEQLQAEVVADYKISSASDVNDVDVVSRESVPPEHVRVCVCMCGGGGG